MFKVINSYRPVSVRDIGKSVRVTLTKQAADRCNGRNPFMCDFWIVNVHPERNCFECQYDWSNKPGLSERCRDVDTKSLSDYEVVTTINEGNIAKLSIRNQLKLFVVGVLHGWMANIGFNMAAE